MRKENLPAVTGGANSRGAVHRNPDVPFAGQLDRPRVDPHPDPNLERRRPPLGAQRLLCGDGGENRVARPREGDEERVSLRVDDMTSVIEERRAQDTLLPSLDRGIVIAELPEQPRGAFDVAEEEGQRTGGLLGHEGYSGG